MYLEHFLIPEVNETNVYLVACERRGQALVVDAGGFTREIVDRVLSSRFHVGHILITHDHYDHVDGLEEYMGAFPDSKVVSSSGACGGAVAQRIADNDEFSVGDLTIRALHIPGHTESSTAYHVALCQQEAPFAPTPSILFSGDTLFAGSIGGTIGASAHSTEVNGIREKIFALPDSTIICPGHGPMTTVGIEKNANPFFN